MSVWNNSGTKANWQGNGETSRSRTLYVSTINADEIFTKDLYANYISTGILKANSISSLNGSIGFLSNLVLRTGVIQLGISPTYLTAEAGVLYVNGDAVAFPSSFSTIADWSQFKAVANVNMSRSSIYNVLSISTNTISTGSLLTRSISTTNLKSDSIGVNNISSVNIGFDTLNGRAGVIGTLTGSNIVYSNAILSNLTSLTMNTRQLNTSNVLASNSITTFAISSVIVSTGYIVADVGFFNSTFNSTIFSYKGQFQSTATGFLIANNISTGFIATSNLLATNISNVESLILSSNRPSIPWNSATLYAPGDIVFVSPFNYVAKFSNLNINPQSNIKNWVAGNYLAGEAAFVAGVGSYSCVASGFYTITPNGLPGTWVIRGVTNSANLLWSITDNLANPVAGTISGNSNSLVKVGTVSSIYINAPTIVASNLISDKLNTNNISSGSVNINILNTSNIKSYNITNSNLLSNAGDTRLNTLTTSGNLTANATLTTNGNLNVNNSINLATADTNNNINGTTTTNFSPLGTQTRFYNSFNNIKNIACERIDITGGGTGNTVLPPYRNNSIVNIGETEFSPAIVSINGFNPTGDTTALTVNGQVNVNVGSFNSYYVANFYPINIEANAINVYGISFLNGGVLITGLLEATGAITVTGLAQLTGDLNVTGLTTLTGETNILGLLTAEAGIAIVGATTIQGGDIIIGTSPGGGAINNFNLYNYYNGTDVQNLTVNGRGDFRQNVNIDNNLTVGGLIYGTVVSGSGNVSTLNVSTVRAFNISTNFLTAGQSFINSISTNSISTGFIKAETGLFHGISTNSISSSVITANEIYTYSLGNPNGFVNTPINVNNSLNLGENSIFNVKSLTTSNISTNLISTGSIYTGSAFTNSLSTGLITSGALDVIVTNEYALSAGNVLIYSQNGTQIQDNQNVNIIAGTDINLNTPLGYTYAQYVSTGSLYSSTLNVNSINSLSDINLNTPFGYTNIQYASVGSLYTSTLNVDSIYNFSTQTSTLNFYNATGRIIDLKYADEEGVGIALYRNIDGVPTLDALIGTDNITGFSIVSISTINIQASSDDIGITSGKVMALAATDLVVINTPEFEVSSNATISSITTSKLTASNVSSISMEMNYATVLNDLSANNLFTTNLLTYFIGNPLPYQAPVTFNDNLNISGNNISNTFLLESSNISTNFLSTGSLFVNNSVGNSISSLRISSGSLFSGSIITSSIDAAVNINIGKSLIPFTGTNLDLGSSNTFRWRNLWVSTISSIHVQTSTVATTQIAVDRIVGNASATNIFTNNLFPISGGAQIGFGPTTNSGGYYNFGHFRSTFTSVIQPDAVAGQLSNVVRINGNVSTNNLITNLLGGSGPFGKLIFTDTLLPNGFVNIGNAPVNSFQQGWFNTTYTNTIQANTNTNIGINSTVRVLGTLSTQNEMISSINLKQYPYTSTLNIPYSSFSITGNQAGNPILLYSNIDFRTQGFHRISQKSILSKNTGGASADIHGSIFYTVGAFPSTPSITDGYSALPFVKQDNASTFTTLMTEFYVSTPTTRNIFYYDSTANNYTARLYMGTLFDSLTPDFGNNPTRIPNIL